MRVAAETLKEEPGICKTPPTETSKLAELPGMYPTPPIRNGNEVVVPLNNPEISSSCCRIGDFAERTPAGVIAKVVLSTITPPKALVVAGTIEIVPVVVMGPPTNPAPVLTSVTEPIL
jgi:hypothetical protein